MDDHRRSRRRPERVVSRATRAGGNLNVIETCLPGIVLLAPRIHGDERGFFVETYSAADWSAVGIPPQGEFVQDNHSRSRRGTVRGLHFQTHPGQGKLVRCARGSVVDVVVDLRRGSPTFSQWVPIGFAHGFCVTSEVADFVYKTTSYYDSSTESAIRFDDPEVGVIWPDVDLLYSERDRAAPTLSEIAAELPFTFQT
jgi:dTDP-4-dehydrorhamnose 3,5-epimerase